MQNTPRVLGPPELKNPICAPIYIYIYIYIYRHRAGEGYKQKFCCTEGSQERCGSHNYKMKEVWHSQDTSNSCSPNWWRRALSRQMTQNQNKNHCNTPSIWDLWRCGQTQFYLQWRHMKKLLEFVKQHLKVPQTLSNKSIWSEEPQF